MNITRASGEPLSSLSTALRPHMAGHCLQLAASTTSSLNSVWRDFFTCVHQLATKRHKDTKGTREIGKREKTRPTVYPLCAFCASCASLCGYGFISRL